MLCDIDKTLYNLLTTTQGDVKIVFDMSQVTN